MEEVRPSRGAIGFGVFEVDLRAGELRRQGVKVKLQEQPFQILQILLEHPGEVVTREELQQRIWPADTFVDFDHGLNNAIKRLREALGDSADTPRYVETLPRRGYRFLSPVNGTSGFTAHAPGAEPQPQTFLRRWVVRSLAILASVALLIGVLLGLNPGQLRERLLGKSDVPVIRSLAVLPLKNLSDDPAQKYFAYGVAEELIANLSQISTLKVASHTSALRYENTDKTVPEIARELHVDAVVEGAVQRSGDRVRITAQLIYAPNDTHVWARSYDRDVRDVLALQSDVAREIANEIQLKMTPVEAGRLARPRVVNPKALDAYWKGQYHLAVLENVVSAKGQEKLSEDELHQALASFQQAIQLDPNYAPAYLGYSEAIWEFESMNLRPDLLASGRSALMKALELDDSLAKAHWALAERYFYEDWNWAAAEKEYKRALEVEPNSAEAHYRYANYLDAMGRLQEGLKEHDLQLQLDPDLSDAFDSPLTPLELRIERMQKRKVIATRGGVVNEKYLVLGILLARAGRYEEATEEWRTLMTRLGWTDISEAIRRGYATAGFHGALREWAKGLESAAKHRYIPRSMLVYIYGTLGENDRAFAWLEKAYEERDGALPSGLKVAPDFDPIRSDPRFAKMVHRVGLPP